MLCTGGTNRERFIRQCYVTMSALKMHFFLLTLYKHIKYAEQQTVMHTVIKYSFAKADEIVRKLNAFKQ